MRKYYICILINISDQLLITKLYNSFIKVDACGKILPIGKVHGGLEKVLKKETYCKVPSLNLHESTMGPQKPKNLKYGIIYFIDGFGVLP